MMGMEERIKRLQQRLGLPVDGLVGPVTLTRLESLVDQVLGKAPTPAEYNLECSRVGLDLIVEFEISSQEHYERRLVRPTWPGGESGVTIGIGYDLGFATRAQIRSDWRELPEKVVERLVVASRVTGTKARDLVPSLRDLRIPFAIAKGVFYTRSLVQYAVATRRVYPGVEFLPADTQSMMLSLVFNRGTKLTGPTRKEMQELVPLVKDGDLPGMAAQFRSMKRIWQGAGLTGLLVRREKEAVLIEKSRREYTAGEIVYL
ncbi:MAG: peptidoglycan-binding protein [Blastocatellia bacterium]